MLEGNEYQEKGKNVKGNWELVEMGRCHLFKIDFIRESCHRVKVLKR